MKNMSKKEYITEIVKLLEQCNKESTLYFIHGLLMRLIASGEPG